MGSIYIEGFKFGMDRRRQRVAGPRGTLWGGKNVVISRGGDIERAKAFVPVFNLPAGQTFGMGIVRDQIYVFGAGPNPGVPIGVQYQQLAAPSGAPMTQVLDVRAAGGQMYVIATYADGNIYHFYNGARITDWDTVADSNTNFAILTQYLADLIGSDPNVSAVASGQTILMTARTPGVGFVVAESTTDFGGINDQAITLSTVQPSVPAVSEVVATSNVTILAGSPGVNNVINDVLVNGVSLMQATVPFTIDIPTTLNAVASQINDKSLTHGYTAAVSGATLIISAAPGTGTTPNNFSVVARVGGNVVLNTPSMGGGIANLAPQAQIVSAVLSGTFQSVDLYQITINGTTYSATGRAAGTGTSAFVSNKRVFLTAASIWEYCAINTFNDFHTSTPASGSGFVNVSNDAEGSERLIGSGAFIQQAAVFTRKNIIVYNMSADATQITLSQPINGTGTRSPRAVLGYGTTDLFYLDTPGIRSLSARFATTLPFVNDIGVPLDPFIRAHMNTLAPAVIQRACAVVEPYDARFWMALDNRVYVLSYFPGSQISGWTYFEPGFSITDFARTNDQLYARAGDTIYQYGGTTGTVYPSVGQMVADIEIPFVYSNPPALNNMLGFDLASLGEWFVTAIVDPNISGTDANGNPVWNQFCNVGTIDGISFAESGIAFPGETSHVAFNLTCSAAGNASISSMTVHTTGEEAKA